MSADLEALLAEWLPAQRWFGSKGRPITGVAVAERPELPGDGLAVVLAQIEVAYDDGGKDRYQVPLVERSSPCSEAAHAEIGAAGGSWWYDAIHDAAALQVLLEALRTEATAGPVTFHRLAEIPAGLRGRSIGVEQSNSSLVFGDELIVKVFRRLSPGRNPDLEVTRALQDAGSSHVAPVRGWVQAPLDGVESTLAVAQEFVRGGSEGWALAVASVRDLYAEADLHADEVGGDFAGESERLGRATAEVHADLAGSLPSEVRGPDHARHLADAMRRRLAEACDVVTDLTPFRSRLEGAYAELAEQAGEVAVQRVHGDYHLGQVLRTDTGWILLDFEGEPAKPLAERTALDSPLRDVAGMLRSFDYAARHLLAERPTERHLAYRATEWAERNREAFCDGYAAAAGHDPRTSGPLLRAFELDKAVYEVVYEARNRPSWLPIPLGSIERLVA